MQKQIQKLPKSLVEVSVTVPWAEVSSNWDQAVAKIGSNIDIAGFRRGQAPAEMVERGYFQQIQQEFLQVVMPNTLMQALQGSDVVPIDYPQYQIVSFNKGQDLVFKGRVTQRPMVAVGNYKAIKVTKPAPKQVTEADVDKIINDLFNRWKAKLPQNATAPQPPQTTPQPNGGGSGSMSFSANANTNLNQPIPTQPNDDFAKGVGAQNLADLKAKIKKDLEDEASYNNELDYEEAILQEVEKITTVDLPDILVQDELNRMLVSLQRRVADMGLLLEDYLKGQNKTLDQLKNEWKPQAEKNVRMELGLSEIARMEKVDISDVELQAEVDKVQDGRLKQQFEQQEPRMHLRHALRQTKTLNLLKTVVS